MNIETYIVNLKTSTERKEYMKNLLSEYPFLNINFIEAVDGRKFTDEERDNAFDVKESILRYGRQINGGEIGCTLSHYKCYKKLANSKSKYVLILEDDISIVGNLNIINDSRIEKFMSDDKPKILFLSGDYWFWRNKPITCVFDAVGSYAYMINSAAVSLILEKVNKPSNVADDWRFFHSLGIKLYAIHPYIVDANLVDLQSEICQEHWGNIKSKMKFKYVLRTLYTGFIKMLLVKFGHFESKVR